ncbi:MAG TPA: hypothetical protein VL049_07650, partial [Candidatus Dormibacteraeota bacterium]|nr:hypothetical protein [Candidatus Dormibacteraeota bacterium]
MAVVDADRRLVIPTGMRRLVYALGDDGEHQVRIGAFDGRGADPALALSSPARQVGSAGPPGRRASSQYRAHRHGTPPARVADMRG